MMLLPLSGIAAASTKATTDDYIKNIEIVETDIDYDQQEFPPAAYLRLTLKNGGDRNVSYLAFEVKYYEEGDYLIKKTIVKYKLSEVMEGGQTQKYKIRLKGDIVNLTFAQYPYAQANKVDSYDLKIVDAKFIK